MSTTQYVSVGSGTNSIAYSTDGATWTGIGQSIFSSAARSVAFSATQSRWVAVGEGTNSIAYSSDGIAWTGLGTSILLVGSGIAYSETQSQWVAVGQGSGTAPIAYSSDGINWTSSTNSTSIFTSAAYGIAYSAQLNRWVAVGEGTNTIAYSSDGIGWTGLGMSIFNQIGRGIAYSAAQSQWVATGEGSGEGATSIAYSSDGITWIGTEPRLYDFASHTFTTAGQTGREGPLLAAVRGAYTSTGASWASSYVNMPTPGIQEWTVPATGSYTIRAAGAQGASTHDIGGSGIILELATTLVRGETIKILVGQSGFWNGWGGGGGGGTFVVRGTQTSPIPIIVAGGGGGTDYNNSGSGRPENKGSIDTPGKNGGVGENGGAGGAGGVNGNGGNSGAGDGGGGGLLTNGGNTNGGASFVNGGVGGEGISDEWREPMGGDGGFGGGGAVYVYGGGGAGGGGYSGGGSGGAFGGGGGGGSYGISSLSNIGFNAGQGYVAITFDEPLYELTFNPSNRGVAYSDELSRWVVTGEGTNSIAYSSNGAIWFGTTGKTIFSDYGTGVAYSRELNKWVAVGQGTNAIAYSTDGIAWTGLGTSIFSVSGSGVAANYNLPGTSGFASSTFTVPSSGARGSTLSITVIPSSESSGAITYESLSPDVATINASTGVITMVSLGEVIFRATQAATYRYNSSTRNSNTLTVLLANTLSTATFAVPATKTTIDSPFSITALVSDSDSVITYTSSNAAVATVDASTGVIVITLVGGAGNVVFTATQAATSTHASATVNSNTLVVSALINFQSLTKSVSSAFILTPPTSTLETTYGSTWNQVGDTFTVEGPSTLISADGLTVAIVSTDDDAGGTNRGSVKVYRWINSAWTLVGSPFYGLVDNEPLGAYLGKDGNTIAINYLEAMYAQLNTSKKGFTAVFYYNPSKAAGSNDVTSALFGPIGWSILGAPIYNESNGDNLSVPRLSGNNKIIAIGTPYNDGTSGNINDSRGSVRVYAYDSTKVTEETDQSSPNFGPIGWTRMGQDIDGGKAGDIQGSPIELSLDGTILAVGIRGDDSLPSIMGPDANLGVTKIFYWNGVSTWSQRGRNIYQQTYSIYDNNLYSPNTMAMSANGNIIACGNMPYGSHRGIASSWVWNPVSSDYMPLASQLNEYGDWSSSGFVALSSDGTILANGANDADVISNGGNIRVYKLTTKSTTLISPAPSNMASYISDVDLNNTRANGTIYRVTLTGAVTGGTVWGTNIYTHDSDLAMAAVHAGVVANGETKEVYVVMERPQVYWFGTTRLGVTSSNFGPVSGPYPLGSYGSYFFQTEPRHWLKIGNDIFGSSGQVIGEGTQVSADGTRLITTGSNIAKVFSIGSSGNFSYTSGNTEIAQVYGNIVVPLSGGQTTITSTQSASGENPQDTISTELVIQRISSTFSAATFSVASSKTFGDASFAIITQPTSNSDGAVTYSSRNTAVATIDASGNWITLVGAGDVSFNAVQAETAQYTSAQVISNTLTVARGTSAFSAATFSVASSKTFGDASFAIITQPTSESSGAVAYSSRNTAVATIDASGNWITLVGAGDVSFNAVQAETAQYEAATATSNTLTVERGTSAFATSTFSVASSKTFGDASFAIITQPTSESSGAVEYTSNNTAVATIDASGTWITLVSAGDVSFNAVQAETAQYEAATATSNTLTVERGTSAFSAATFSVASSKTFGDVSFAIITQPTSESSGAVAYSSRNTAVATIDASGTWITLVSAGDVSFNAVQAETAQYAAATATSNTLTVARGTSAFATSTFSVASSKTLIDASFAITTRPTSDSSGAVAYTSNNTAVATIDVSGTWITLVGAGDVSFNAVQAETAQYEAATATSNTLTVSKATTSLVFAGPPTAKNVVDAAFTVTASTASAGAVTYSSSNASFATVHPTTGLVTLKGAGTVTITAAQAATDVYNAPTNATYSVVISAAGSALVGQTISSGTSFNAVDLSGASFEETVLTGVVLSGANLSNVNFSGAVITGANFTNANISGATNLPAFSTTQKLQLLSNINNVAIGAVQITTPLSGGDINALLPSPVAALASATFTLKVPTSLDASFNKVLAVSVDDVSNNASLYIPMNASEGININGTVLNFDGAHVRDANNTIRNYLTISGAPFKIYAGSIIGLNVSATLNSITFTGDNIGLYDIMMELFALK